MDVTGRSDSPAEDNRRVWCLVTTIIGLLGSRMPLFPAASGAMHAVRGCSPFDFAQTFDPAHARIADTGGSRGWNLAASS